MPTPEHLWFGAAPQAVGSGSVFFSALRDDRRTEVGVGRVGAPSSMRTSRGLSGQVHRRAASPSSATVAPSRVHSQRARARSGWRIVGPSSRAASSRGGCGVWPTRSAHSSSVPPLQASWTMRPPTCDGRRKPSCHQSSTSCTSTTSSPLPRTVATASGRFGTFRVTWWMPAPKRLRNPPTNPPPFACGDGVRSSSLPPPAKRSWRLANTPLSPWERWPPPMAPVQRAEAASASGTAIATWSSTEVMAGCMPSR
jgi:hypothetical protein